MKSIVIIGAGGFGREVLWLIEEINKKNKQFNILGFLDDNPEKLGNIINGYKVIGCIDYLDGKNNIYFTCAIGNAEVKANLVMKALSFGGIPQTLIHPSVICNDNNIIGEGCIICASSIITVNAKIGDYVIINLACTIGHDTFIEDYCTLYPSVNISGKCKIGKLCEIGTKSAIIQGIEVKEKTIVGAGTIIIKNVNGNCTVVGVPARCIKENNI